MKTLTLALVALFGLWGGAQRGTLAGEQPAQQMAQPFEGALVYFDVICTPANHTCIGLNKPVYAGCGLVSIPRILPDGSVAPYNSMQFPVLVSPNFDYSKRTGTITRLTPQGKAILIQSHLLDPWKKKFIPIITEIEWTVGH